eukprot:jgi/Tetstr1/423188/TSEL_001308.t1
MSINVFEARSHKPPPRLARLDALLEQADLYSPINVTEFLRDMRKYSLHDFLQAMRKGLSNPFMCWTWRYGGSRPGLALHHIWKVPPRMPAEGRADMVNKSNQLSNIPRDTVEVQYSRAAKQAYYANVLKPSFMSSKAAARAVFEYLTGGKLPFDGSDEAGSPASYALFVDDPDIIFDLGKLNGEPGSTEFDVFWTKFAAQLEEHKRVDDRRHGQNKLPFNISIRAMVNKVVKALEEEHGDLEEAGISVPSHAWGGMGTMLVARTAPQHSWASPAERVMGTINLALQCVALARMQMGEEFEAVMAHCHGMARVSELLPLLPTRERADSISSSAKSVNKDDDDIVMEDEVMHVDDNTAEVVIIDDDAEAAPLAGDAPAAPAVLDGAADNVRPLDMPLDVRQLQSPVGQER